LISGEAATLFTKADRDKIDAFMQANSGFLRKADFESNIDMVDPVSVNYRGYDVFGIAAEQSASPHCRC